MTNLTETRTLVIYTDGSVAPNNHGGAGVRIISIDSNGDEIMYDSQSAGFRNVNSGQMEIIACIEGLKEATRTQLLSSIERVILITDSKYVYDKYKKAMFEWSKKRWVLDNGRPVQNAHLWKILVQQLLKYKKDKIFVDIQWVEGHNGDEHNIAVDAMAKRASRLPLAKVPKNNPITIFQPRKIIPSRKLQIGSVKMMGQKISIKILSGKLLKPQNIWCYQYQVITRTSPYFGLVDQIFSKETFDLNRTYFVKVNKVTSNPTIERVYWEIRKP